MIIWWFFFRHFYSLLIKLQFVIFGKAFCSHTSIEKAHRHIFKPVIVTTSCIMSFFARTFKENFDDHWNRIIFERVQVFNLQKCVLILTNNFETMKSGHPWMHTLLKSVHIYINCWRVEKNIFGEFWRMFDKFYK